MGVKGFGHLGEGCNFFSLLFTEQIYITVLLSLSFDRLFGKLNFQFLIAD